MTNSRYNEVASRHRRRWGTDGDRDSSLNETIDNFNELVDELLVPSAHTIEYTIPFEININNKLQDNILISDVSRQEQIKDQKLLHVKLSSQINSGSYIWWDNTRWIVMNEEHNSVQSHRSYTITKCAVDIKLQVEGTVYVYPIYANNLTLYADGSYEMVNLTKSSAKYSLSISENDITNTIEVGTRFILKGRAFEVSVIDDVIIDNVRTFTVCETVLNTFDDVEGSIAYNENSIIKDVKNPNEEIIGTDNILIGDIVEYTFQEAISWELEENDALIMIDNELGTCKVKCKSSSSYIGNIINLKALDENGEVIKTKKIRIGGIF